MDNVVGRARMSGFRCGMDFGSPAGATSAYWTIGPDGPELVAKEHLRAGEVPIEMEEGPDGKFSQKKKEEGIW